ncbi:MAG: SRPBCC family protein [Candidatus Saccharibacteria bacterium]
MQDHSVIYADFTIKRTMDAPAERVYQAFADQAFKEKWFGGPVTSEHTMDFRVGGSELNRGTFHDGVVHTFKAAYYDIVPNKRIVYAYEMYLDDKRISVSLATIELAATGNATELTLHESGAFLDGFDKPEVREQGTQGLLNALEDAVKN